MEAFHVVFGESSPTFRHWFLTGVEQQISSSPRRSVITTRRHSFSCCQITKYCQSSQSPFPHHSLTQSLQPCSFLMPYGPAKHHQHLYYELHMRTFAFHVAKVVEFKSKVKNHLGSFGRDFIPIRSVPTCIFHYFIGVHRYISVKLLFSILCVGSEYWGRAWTGISIKGGARSI